MPSLTIRTLDRREREIDAAAIDKLRAALKGPVIFPGDAGYEDSRTIWNAMIDRKPAVVVKPLGTADVVACVNFARELELMLTIKGGGHNIAGLSVCDGGVLLDMSLMRGVFVDRGARTAAAQAGCLLGDVDRETQLHGLAAVLGFVSNTGVAGLTLGGGFGYLTRRYGWTCDNVVSMDLVTPRGELIRASTKENAELFWALRGGGGNFGVVTGFTFNLYPVGPEMVGGVIAWPASEAPKVLEMFQSMHRDAPPEVGCAAMMRLAPPAPWLSKDIHGKPIVGIVLCHTGPVADGEKYAARLKSFGTPVGDVIMKRSYVSQQAILDATQPKGRRYYWKSEYLPGISDDVVKGVMQHAARISSPHSAVILFPIDGPLNGLPADHSPAGNRDAKVVLNVTASWDKADDDRTQVDWARSSWQDMRRFSTGGTYINFLTEEEGEDRIQSAYGGNLARLSAIKTKWDPTNMFCNNKNVKPA